jgi:hypothetical protein
MMISAFLTGKPLHTFPEMRLQKLTENKNCSGVVSARMRALRAELSLPKCHSVKRLIAAMSSASSPFSNAFPEPN